MDILELRGLTIPTIIGVHAWEQAIKQPLVLDISIPSDFSLCHDTLAKTLDYTTLSQTVTEFLENHSFTLIESVAEKVAELIKTTFSVHEVTLQVCKPGAIKNASNVCVRITR